MIRRLAVTLGLAAGAAVLVAAPAQAAASTQDASWLRAAHQYNLTEISAGSTAQSHASSATVKRLGAMFVADHTAGDATLRATASKLGVSLPTTPNPTQRHQLAQASAVYGSAFNALFLAQQTAGHRQALAAGKTELASGSDARVLSLARATAPVVQKHLNELLAAQGSSSPTSINAGSGGQAATRQATPTGTGVAALGLLLVAGGGTVLVRRARAGG